MKFGDVRPLADPDVAARKIMEIANSLEPLYGRFLVERMQRRWPFRLPNRH
jgi:hypothetical protein